MEIGDRISLLCQVATWYYEDGLGQSEIAAKVARSRSMVSRMLTEARRSGLVSVTIRFPLPRCPSLENELSDAFGLSGVQVLENRGFGYHDMLRRLGHLAAHTLQSHLHSEVRVTLGWGAALRQTVLAMPQITLEDATVIQVMGSVGDREPSVDGAELAMTLATRLSGDYRFLAAPLFVASPDVAQSLLADPTIAHSLELARRSDVALAGVGAIDHHLSGLHRAGYFDTDEIAALQRRGVVGDLLGFLLDADGQVLDIPQNRRLVSLHPEALSDVLVSIGVAGGAEKAATLLAALRGGYLDVLVTDSTAAAELLRVHEQTRGKAG